MEKNIRASSRLKEQAREAGLKRYFTGKPCRAGHMSERDVSSGRCVECKRLEARKYAAQNRAKFREYHRSYARKRRALAAEPPKPKAPTKRAAPQRVSDRLIRSAIERCGPNCWYCGRAVSVGTVKGCADYGLRGCADHAVPKSAGGSDDPENLVPACMRCNSIKCARSIEAARPSLLLARIGWPSFTEKQIVWLRSRNFDMSDLDHAKLYFEDL